jgi:hypothetical protein
MAILSSHVKKSVTMLLCSVALAGCSGGSDTPPSAQGNVPPPDIVVVNHGLPATQAAATDETKVMAPSELKPDETTMVVETPPLQEGIPQPLEEETAAPVEIQTPATPAMVDGTEAGRIALLEKEVAALRADYNAMMPAFNGLITTNERIQKLLMDLEKQAGMKGQETQAQAVSDPVTVAPASGGPVVSGLRMGEHGDKTRLVLDVSSVTAYATDINDAEKQLVITLPEAGWAGKGGAQGLRSPLVDSWMVKPGEKGGSIVTVMLKKAAKITGTERLKAPAEGGSARIVIDIAANPGS